MTTYYVKNSNEPLKQGENVLVWFGNASVKGCQNAMVLYGGDVLLLKTAEQISKAELLELIDDRQKWREKFGDGSGSEELLAAVRKSYQANKG